MPPIFLYYDGFAKIGWGSGLLKENKENVPKASIHQFPAFFKLFFKKF